MEELIQSYNNVFYRTMVNSDFLRENIGISRSLFTQESLKLGSPVTRDLHVIALLYGLPFNIEQLEILQSYISELKNILGNALYYFVKPENFGLELCVIKWPEEKVDNPLIHKVQNLIDGLGEQQMSGIVLEIHGIQINPDGCVVARGVDRNGTFRDLRKRIFNSVPELPKRQSQWVHIPLGRVLEPIGEDRFNKLIHYIKSTMQSMPILFGNVGSLKMIEEFQWYMERNKVLKTY